MSFRTLKASTLFSLTACVTLGTWWGCSAASDTTGASSTGMFTSSSSSGGEGGAGGTSAVMSSSAAGINTDGGPDDGGLDDGGVCTGTTATATLIPLDMVILLDESGSMDGQKWTTVTAALKTFVSDPLSAGISVGIEYFPVIAADDCVFQDYAQLKVPVALLPGNAKALSDSIDGEMPQGGTPTYGALKGALYAATTYQDAHPTHKVIVVLATDGDPTSCTQTDIPTIAALSASALAYNGVQTYVIGVPGATVTALDAIAKAGGTMQSYDVTQNVMQFSQKMNEIRTSALQCSFDIPPPPGQAMLDPTKVNVIYTPMGMGKPKALPNVKSMADCMGKQGWYYDDNKHPTKIELCPASCTNVQGDLKAQVDVQFGCTTMIN